MHEADFIGTASAHSALTANEMLVQGPFSGDVLFLLVDTAEEVECADGTAFPLHQCEKRRNFSTACRDD